jgi:hypothetical protein
VTADRIRQTQPGRASRRATRSGRLSRMRNTTATSNAPWSVAIWAALPVRQSSSCSRANAADASSGTYPMAATGDQMGIGIFACQYARGIG